MNRIRYRLPYIHATAHYSCELSLLVFLCDLYRYIL